MMLQVEDLVVNYDQLRALRGVSLSVDTGRMISLIGSNGAGKTTLLNAISGLIPVAAGRVLWNGRTITGLPPDEICRLGIVQVPEGRKLFAGMTVLENLEMGAYLRAARLKLRDNLSKVFDIFPRLADRCRQRAGSLSGGEQQMLAVGRALMAGPELLVLDEPSLGLAPVSAADIFRVVAMLNKEGLSVLLVSQEVRRSLAVSSYGYLLENGSIVASGPSELILNDPRVKEAYLGQ
ncbi:MAG: ABC transporter ATP-binding protein [Pseudomonadota bacterium]